MTDSNYQNTYYRTLTLTKAKLVVRTHFSNILDIIGSKDIGL